MKHAIKTAAGMGIGALAAIGLSMAPANATSTHFSARAVGGTAFTVKSANAPSDCGPAFCDYKGTNYGHLCFASQGQNQNWGWSDANDCRNEDESVYNGTGYYVRLYYSPEYGGAHVCINAHDGIPNLSGYTFNSGPGLPGYGSRVENDVASDTFSQSRCTNPL